MFFADLKVTGFYRILLSWLHIWFENFEDKIRNEILCTWEKIKKIETYIKIRKFQYRDFLRDIYDLLPIQTFIVKYCEFFFFKSNQNCVLSWFCWTTKQSHNILEIYFKFKEYCDWIGVSKVKSPYYLTWFPHDHACCTSSLLRPQLFLRSSFSLYFPCSTHIHQNLTLQLW